MIKKWECLTSKEVYSNKFIKVFDEEVLAPTGVQVNYGRVNFRRVAASVSVIDFHKKQILLVGQNRYPILMYSWETIQGGSKLGTNPYEIAMREMNEEANLGVTRNHLNFICKTHTSNSVTDEKAYLFWCDVKNTTNIDLINRVDPTELIKIKWYSINDCLQMLNQEIITDALTQVSLLHISKFLF